MPNVFNASKVVKQLIWTRMMKNTEVGANVVSLLRYLYRRLQKFINTQHVYECRNGINIGFPP